MSRILALADAEDTAPRASLAAREQLDAARAEARHAAPSDLVLVRVQLPAIAPEALVERFPEQDAVLWLPPSGPAFAGIGAAAAITGQGPSRFAEVRAAAGAAAG